MRVDLLFYQSNFRLLVNMPQVPKLPRMNQTQTQKWFSNLIDWKQPNFRFKVVIERVKASLWESNWFGPGLKCSWDIIGTSSGTPLHSPEIFGIRNHLRGAETFNDICVRNTCGATRAVALLRRAAIRRVFDESIDTNEEFWKLFSYSM